MTVEPPPGPPKTLPTNPIARLMPIVTVIAAVGMIAVYFTSGVGLPRSPMFVLFPVMMLMSAIGTAAYGARSTSRSAELDEGRRDYLRYLDTVDELAIAAATDQRTSLQWTHPVPQRLWTLVGGPRMWERSAEDADFCHVRVGLGERPLSVALVTPALPASDSADPVTASAVRRLIRERSTVGGLPVTVALRDFPVIIVDGDVPRVRGVVRAVVCQLAVLHDPRDLWIAVAAHPGRAAEWEWLKWFPHHQHPEAIDSAGSLRLLYSNVEDAVAQSGRLRAHGPGHTLVILDGGVDAGARPDTDTERWRGVTIVDVAPSRRASRATGRQLRIAVSDTALTVSAAHCPDVVALADTLTVDQALLCARRLAPYRPAAVGDSRTRTATAWLDLIGIDDPERIEPQRLWQNRIGAASLRVPVGVCDAGRPVELDINEAARGGMGPHGLCVGATGSGKSEFLRTLALGMIAAHPPDVLNLVLVDFKGGATFLGMQRARHVSAIITNLADEAALVSRMRDALAGEMTRRQELLRAAKVANLTDYARARSEGRPLPSLAALFVIVDEFSELLSQHPDFAEMFVAIGRLGRSLGIHLLLASQRLDEGRLRGLESHLSYRICLKTFSTSESRAVLGVPDAYHLPAAPGAAILKTASGELVRFQTAFVSAPSSRRGTARLQPARRRRHAEVFIAGPVGPIARPGETIRAGHGTVDATLMDTVLDRIAGHGSPAHPVWLPPLSQSPTLDMLVRRDAGSRDLATPIGLIDKPYQQRQEPLWVELFGATGNIAVVGAPRSGKSTVLRTLIMGLAAGHRAGAVQFYCLDFGGGTLSSLRSLPHVGSVAGRLDPELCRRTVTQVEAVVRTREIRFRELGIESIASYRERRNAGDPALADDPYGDVFLVVDGWATLRRDFERLEESITAVAAQGLSFGVHVAVTAARWAELRPGLKDQLGTRVELRLGDPADSEMDRKRARLLGAAPPGRGITGDGLELAIALPRLDGKPTADDLGEAIAAAIAQLAGGGRAERSAPPVKLLPLHVDHSRLIDGAASASTQVVIGVAERDMTTLTVDVAAHPHLVVIGESQCGKTAVLRLLCREILRTNDADGAQLDLVDFRRTLLGVVETGHLAGYSMAARVLASRVSVLAKRLEARMPGDTVTQHQLRTRSWWSGPDVFVIVDDYDLVATPAGNPLAPLVDFIPHSRDVGLHVIVARNCSDAARAMFDPMLAALRDQGCMALMMSAGPDGGGMFGSVRPAALPPGRGTLIARGQPDQLVQVAWSDPP